MLTGEWMYWLGWAGAIVVMLCMIIMAWWALFSDRPRGRRRCPKCWYDMSYSPGMSCSECGFTATDEHQLHRTRRRWGYGVLATATTFVLTYNIHQMSLEHGFASILPTRVLTIGMAFTDDLHSPVFLEVRRRFTNGLLTDHELGIVINRAAAGDWRAAPPDEAWQATYGSLIRNWRFELSRMIHREEDVARVITLREIEDRLAHVPVSAELTARHEWPRNVPAVALLRIEEWWPLGSMMRVRATPAGHDAPSRTFYQTNDTMSRSAFGIPLGVLNESVREIEIDVRVDWRREEHRQWQEVWHGRLSVPVRVVGELEDAIEPVATIEQNEAIRQTFQGEIRRWTSGRSPLRFYYRPDFTSGPAFEDVAIGVALKLKHNDRLIRELHMWWLGGADRGSNPLQHFGWEIIHEDLEGIRTIDADEPGWVFSVEGRPELALRAGEAPQYWSGSYTVPVTFRFPDSTGEAPMPEWWTEEQKLADEP